jgi:hypothetical protein
MTFWNEILKISPLSNVPNYINHQLGTKSVSYQMLTYISNIRSYNILLLIYSFNNENTSKKISKK